MKYKLIFGVRDVTERAGEREASGLESPSFYDVHELSQIVITVDPAELEKHVRKQLEEIDAPSEEMLRTFKRTAVLELAQAACQLMLSAMASKIVDHATVKA